MGSGWHNTTGNRAGSPSADSDGDAAANNAGGRTAHSVPRGQRVHRCKVRRSARRRLIFETLGQRRVLAVITGTVFHDADTSLRAEAGEIGLASRLAYIDSNDNAKLDDGESYALTDDTGRFRFDNLGPGTYPVRLYDGSAGQQQTFPVGATQSRLPATFDNAFDAQRVGDTLQVITPDRFVRADISGTRTSEDALPFVATELVSAISPEGSPANSLALVVGMQQQEGSATESIPGLWLVRPDGTTERLLGTAGEQTDSAQSLTAKLGSDGNGVLVSRGEQGDTVQSLRVTRSGDSVSELSVEVSSDRVAVPAGTQAISSGQRVQLAAIDSLQQAFGTRTVLAWPQAGGSAAIDAEAGATVLPTLQVALWSNSAGDRIAGSQTEIVGATELLDFDDASGLLAVRFAQGYVGILDVDANFAPLHQFEMDPAALRLLPGQDAVVAVTGDASDQRLVLHDLRHGQLLADQALPNVEIGRPVSIEPTDSINQYLLVGSSGIAKVLLNRAKPHTVRIENGSRTVDLPFGVAIRGENHPPIAPTSANLNGDEDQTISVDAADIASMVIDKDHDELISTIVSPPQHGSVHLRQDGGMDYQPDENYYGDDSFSIQFHDGQAVSQPVEFFVSIAAQPDAPTGITFRGSGIPEHTQGPHQVGSITIEDADFGDSYQLSVFDSRFRIDNGNLILISGGLNYEYEPEIPLSITGYDADAGEYFSHQIIVYVEDENDPISAVWYSSIPIPENEGGIYVGNLGASDEDAGQVITFSVDDQRFEVIGDKLYLKPDEFIDFEAEPVVMVNVTASDGAGSTLSTEVPVDILDIAEPIAEINLSNRTLLELEAGAAVGDVQINGVAAASSYELTVDDPRFEIDGSLLKLRDDQFVRRAAADQIEVTLTARDTSHTFDSVSQSFLIEVLENQTPFHNDQNPYDVNGNGSVSPSDALSIINYLNIYGPGPVGPGNTTYGYDVNSDGNVSTLDALLIINHINILQSGGTVGGEPSTGGEGESAPQAILDDQDEHEPLSSDPSVPPPPAQRQSQTQIVSGSEPTNDLATSALTDAAMQDPIDDASPETDQAITDTLDFLDGSDDQTLR